MTWIIFTAISIIFRSIYSIMGKVLSNKLSVSAYTQALLLTTFAGVLSLIFSPLLGGISVDASQVSFIAIALVVLGQGLGNILYFAAMKHLTSGTAQISFSSILVFNTVLALLFTGLQLSVVNVIGVFVLMIAILLVVSGKVEVNKRGIALMIAAAFFFSIFQLASAKLSQQVSPATYLLIAYFGASAVVFLLKAKPIIRDIASHKNKTLIVIPLLTALPSIGNFLFAYYAYREAPEPAKVAMLLTSQVVLTVILSYFLLKEKDHVMKKLSATVLVVISAVLIKD